MNALRIAFQRRLLLLLCVTASVSIPCHCQTPSPINRDIPVEFQPADPEIKTLFDEARSATDIGNYDVGFSKAKMALDLAEKKGLIGDRALAEEMVAVGYLDLGKMPDSMNLFHASLQDAVDSSNLVLQADVLVALAVEPRIRGNLAGALQLLTQALDRANQSKSLLIRARVLGELGKLQVFTGKIDEGRRSIEEALQIDRTNGYSFEPLHEVYLGDAILSNSAPDLTKAIKQFEDARDLAVQKKNYLALVMAENAMGATYIHKGELQKGIENLEAIRNGKILKDGQPLQMPPSFGAAVAQPLIKVTLLEALAQGYESAQQPDKALNVWNELYAFSGESGFSAAEGEAALKIANIYTGQKDTTNALKYFSISAEIAEKQENNTQLYQTIIGETLLLIRVGRGEEAIPMDERIEEIGRNTKNRKLQFLADLVLAEIYQPLGKINEAKDALEKAQALITPGPTDSEIDGKSVIETYVRLADVYEKLNDPIREMVALQKEYSVALFVKDDKLTKVVATIEGQKLEALHIDQLIEDLHKAGKLQEALAYSEILYIYNGGVTPSGNNEYWNVLTQVPFQLVNQPGGAEFLSENVKLFDPILAIGRIPILQALSEHYLYVEQQPQLAADFANTVVNFIDKSTTGLDAVKARAICALAVANARMKREEIALAQAQECVDLARKSGDPDFEKRANASYALAHIAVNDLGAVQQSLSDLLKNAPNDAGLHEELALALEQNGRFQEAQSELNIALRIFEARGDKSSMAQTYHQMAISLDKNQSADANRQKLAYFESSMKLFQELGDARGQVGAAIGIGQCYMKLAQYGDALSILQTALSLADKTGQRQVIALALANLAQAYSESGDRVSAADFHRKAADAYHNVNDAANEAFSQIGLYFDLAAQHKFDDAFSVLIQARAVAATSSSELAKFYTQLDLGWAYERQGEVELSMVAFREAQRVAENAGNLENLAQSRLALAGLLEWWTGDWQGAGEQAEGALKLYQQLQNKQGEAAADVELGSIYGDRTSPNKDFAKALKYYETAQGLGYGSSVSLDQLEIYLQTRRYADAIKLAREAIKSCRNQKDSDCEAGALISLAESERRQGDLSAAAATLRKAEPLVAKEDDFYLHGRLLYGQANQERSSGHFQKAVELYANVIALVEQIKGKSDNESQPSVGETYDFIYDELVDALYSLKGQSNSSEADGYAAEALKYAEANKAQQFNHSWGKTFLYAAKRQVPADVQEHERMLVSKREELDVELQGAISGSDKSAAREPVTIRKELVAADEDLQLFVNSLRMSYPTYASLKYPEPVELRNIPLHRDETLVETKVTDDSTFVWMIRRDQDEGNRLIAFYKVLQTREWFARRVLALRDSFNGGGPGSYDPHISEDLFQALFPGHYGTELLQSRTIVFIPDDVLFLVPLELLSPRATNGDFKLLGVPTRYYPSASSLRIARNANHTADWKNAFLGVGDPITSPDDHRFIPVSLVPADENKSSKEKVTSADLERGEQFREKVKTRGLSFERLEGTATELREIAKLFSQENQLVDVRTGPRATKESVLETDLTQFRFIHFATHGILPVDTGISEPALVLSLDGKTTESMFLYESDILGLRIDADAVVLSACETGSGKVTRAEGVMSLGRAFMAAGASSVTVSLWKVSDESTQMLMEEYYKNLLSGKSKAEALAIARSSLFAKGGDFKDPFFWAPFVLIGE